MDAEQDEDRQAAQKVRDAAKALNETLYQAHRRGLSVEMEVQSRGVECIGESTRVRKLMVIVESVSKPL